MIIRRKHTANFATISNALANDERLQADEIGILYYLLSRPHDWEVRRPQLAKRFRYGRDAIKRVMWNAMRCGWIVAQKTHLSDGRIFTVYEVRDEPGPSLSDDEIRRALSLGSSEAGEIDPDGGGVPGDASSTDPPPTGQPATGEPATGNTYVVESKEDSTKYGFTKDIPTKVVRAIARALDRWPADHVLSRATAEAAMLSLSDKDYADCEAGIAPYLSDCNAKGRKVCDLRTFVTERRWERFIGKTAQQKPVFLKAYSPQWYRWREYRIATGQSVSFMDHRARSDRNSMWSEPTEWPPPLPKKTAITDEDASALT